MSDGMDLLRRLSPTAAGRVGVPAAQALSSASKGVGELDFASMLGKAQAGELSSGLSVRTSPTSGVELSPTQLARLSIAADRAEAQGATRAVALIDGQAVHLDVATRMVLGKADLSGGKAITNIDAVIVVAEEQATERGAAGMLGSDRSRLSPELLKVLERAREKSKVKDEEHAG